MSVITCLVDGRLLSLDADLFFFKLFIATGLANGFVLLVDLLTCTVSEMSLFSLKDGLPMTPYMPFSNLVTAALVSTFRGFSKHGPLIVNACSEYMTEIMFVLPLPFPRYGRD